MSPPDPVQERVSALDVAGTLKGPAMMRDVFTDAFGAGNANVAINPTTDGTAAAAAALGVSQSFAAELQSGPAGYRDRTPFYTAGYFAAKPSTSLAGITLTTSGAQQLICPVSGACATSIGGVTPSAVFVPNTSDSTDSVLHDLCGARALCQGTILVADGPIGQQVQADGSLAPFTLTGIGKPCASGDSQPVCLHKAAGITGNFVMADSRVSVGAGSIAVLKLDGITPDSTTLPNGTYPRSRAIHLIDAADTDSRVVAWWLWLDGDGTVTHPDHHSAFLSIGTTRGFVAGSL